jgi:hypothetical protein
LTDLSGLAPRGRVKGTVIKVVRTHGSRWGRVQSGAGAESFFNEASLSDVGEFDRLMAGDAVEYEEEADRVNGARAARLVLANSSAPISIEAEG